MEKLCSAFCSTHRGKVWAAKGPGVGAKSQQQAAGRRPQDSPRQSYRPKAVRGPTADFGSRNMGLDHLAPARWEIRRRRANGSLH